MGFAVPADAYDRFMGRYSIHLAPTFADFAQVSSGQRVLDVGCGPGALTTVRGRCLAALGPGPFTIQARVWAARGSVSRG